MHSNLDGVRRAKSFRRFNRALLMIVGEALFLPLFRTGMVLTADRSISIGKCRFWGSKKMIDISTSAAKLIRGEDAGLFSSISLQGNWFWHHPNKAVSCGVFKRVYSVTDGYLAYGAHGVAARIVHAYFYTLAYKGVYLFPSETEVRSDIYRRIRAETFKWLQQHKFPEELTFQFEGAKGGSH